MDSYRMRGVGLLVAAAALLSLVLSAPARADTVTDWNIHAFSALTAAPPAGAGQTPPVSTLHLAMVHGAVYDAVNAIDRRYQPYLGAPRAKRWYSKDAAAATAAYRVLATLLPAQLETLGGHYSNSLAGIPAGPAKDGGIAVGEAAAATMLAARENDGRFPMNPYRFPAPLTSTEPWPAGQWRPTPPAFVNDPFAWVKDVKPFLIESPSEFRSRGPNELTSRKYAREFNEVKELGSATSSVRTADQTDAARFWSEGPVHWTRIARQLSARHGLKIADNARLFAMQYLTAADAAIACWGDKARWLFWRPITAIREADRDGNPATQPDPAWLPLINTPPYPDHPSGLTCIGSAMASSLRDFFGTDRLEFSSTNASLAPPLTRSYTSFSQAVDEIVDARVWSGIHFRTADVQGAKIGRQIARYRKQHYFQRANPRRCEEEHAGDFEHHDEGDQEDDKPDD
jgi:PAP2 superfamily